MTVLRETLAMLCSKLAAKESTEEYRQGVLTRR